MPGLQIAFVHPGVTINRTAGSGTKGQTIGTLFYQQVIEIAFWYGTAPVAVTDSQRQPASSAVTPLQIKDRDVLPVRYGSAPIFHGFAQRCIGRDIERIEIDAVETDIASNSQIFSQVAHPDPARPNSRSQTTAARSFGQAFHCGAMAVGPIRGAGHFSCGFCC